MQKAFDPVFVLSTKDGETSGEAAMQPWKSEIAWPSRQTNIAQGDGLDRRAATTLEHLHAQAAVHAQAQGSG